MAFLRLIAVKDRLYDSLFSIISPLFLHFFEYNNQLLRGIDER